MVAIKRGNEAFIPGPKDAIEVNDLVYIVCTPENISFMREQMGKNEREIKNIIFYGGTRIAQKAVQSLPKDRNIKILEANKELCYALSQKIDNALKTRIYPYIISLFWAKVQQYNQIDKYFLPASKKCSTFARWMRADNTSFETSRKQ